MCWTSGFVQGRVLAGGLVLFGKKLELAFIGSFNFAQPKQFLYTQMSLKTSLWVLTLLTREATSDRVTLGVTAVLTLSAISMDSRSDLPKVSVFIPIK